MNLKIHLENQINQSGPLPVDEFIRTCLSHPQFGYYALKDRFGPKGDFITAPEISQLFGEMMAGLMAYIWQQSGRPAGVNMCRFEPGPGRGTLFADMHRAYLSICPELAKARPIFLEASPYLRGQLHDKFDEHGACFIDLVDQLPNKPLFGIANEFFDTLGVRQAYFGAEGWCWRAITYTDKGFAFTAGPPLSADEALHYHLSRDAKAGETREFSPYGEAFISALSRHIAAYGGAVIICDYGKSDNLGDTIQAIRQHKKTDPFSQLGKTDITHLVDFKAMAKQAESAGARLIGPVEQGAFLSEIGISERAENLRQKDNPAADRALLASLDRLMGADHMGQIFKVALLTPVGEGLPPGFTSLGQPGNKMEGLNDAG